MKSGFSFNTGAGSDPTSPSGKSGRRVEGDHRSNCMNCGMLERKVGQLYELSTLARLRADGLYRT
jgi:hypothetical protein